MLIPPNKLRDIMRRIWDIIRHIWDIIRHIWDTMRRIRYMNRHIVCDIVLVLATAVTL